MYLEKVSIEALESFNSTFWGKKIFNFCRTKIILL